MRFFRHGDDFFRGISLGLTALVTLASLSGCLKTRDEICGQALPELDSRVSAAAEELASQGARRGLSSGDGAPVVGSAPRAANASALLDARERESWREWAERMLVEAQHYLDAVDGLPEQAQVHQEISEIATALVSFHGYARLGRVERMERTLGSVRRHVAKARDLACPATGGGRDVAARAVPRS